MKHNITATKRPLSVLIFTDDEGQLTVQNNLQRKTTRVLSNGVGLSTIASQYRQLNQPDLLVVEEKGQFAITLPLIVPSPDLAKSV